MNVFLLLGVIFAAVGALFEAFIGHDVALALWFAIVGCVLAAGLVGPVRVPPVPHG